MTLEDLKKKPVVSMGDGLKIGEVVDLVIDTVSWKVAELFVDGKPGRGLLSLAHVSNVGPDAVTVEKAEFVVYNVRSTGVSFDEFKGLHVVDGTGTVRGQVADLTYDSSGAIESFDVRQGGVFGIGAHHLTVTPGEIRAVGDKILTIDVPTSEA